MGAINDPYVVASLTALTAAISALWARLGSQGRKLEKLIAGEAACQAELKALKADIAVKHDENVAALARLECVRQPPDRPADGRQPP